MDDGSTVSCAAQHVRISLHPDAPTQDVRPAFRSILFPPGIEPPAPRREASPSPCLIDLNLDQIITQIVEKRNESTLRPIFYQPQRSEAVLAYRQDVFADLDRPEIRATLPAFSDAMRLVQTYREFANKVYFKWHRHMVLLRAVNLYCETVLGLLGTFRSVELRSNGLRDFLTYLSAYAASPEFVEFEEKSRAVRDRLYGITYGMLFRGDKVTVREYTDEPDYATTILERFSRFRSTEVAAQDKPRKKTDPSLNHIEEGILDLAGGIFPDQFGALEAFTTTHRNFLDETVERFYREVEFFIAYLAFITPIRGVGLAFCYPEVSATSKSVAIRDSFDIALAAKLLRESQTTVTNDFQLEGQERFLIVTGPNQGGKTTFARMFGQVHYLASLGCPVPGSKARLFLPDRIYTHFERQEDITNLRGKLEDELVRLHETCAEMTGDSLVVLNEIFNSTSLDDQVFLSSKVLGQILATGATGICVTFLDGLTNLSEKTVSMVSTVVPDDPAQRTFKILRRKADGLAYALSLAANRGVTYEKLRERIRS